MHACLRTVCQANRSLKHNPPPCRRHTINSGRWYKNKTKRLRKGSNNRRRKQRACWYDSLRYPPEKIVKIVASTIWLVVGNLFAHFLRGFGNNVSALLVPVGKRKACEHRTSRTSNNCLYLPVGSVFSRNIPETLVRLAQLQAFSHILRHTGSVNNRL